MAINKEILSKIKAKRAEADKLYMMLEFYAWLQDHGLSYDQIAGFRPLGPGSCALRECRKSCLRLGIKSVWDAMNRASYVRGILGLVRVSDDYSGPGEVVVKNRPYDGRLLDLKLKDGSRAVLPWPPFPEDLLYGAK